MDAIAANVPPMPSDQLETIIDEECEAVRYRRP